tara:strand:- start:573 stop:836 length:264 start_codon:yes stop_codon:yes gene_type:complete
MGSLVLYFECGSVRLERCDAVFQLDLYHYTASKNSLLYKGMKIQPSVLLWREIAARVTQVLNQLIKAQAPPSRNCAAMACDRSSGNF